MENTPYSDEKLGSMKDDGLGKRETKKITLEKETSGKLTLLTYHITK